MRSITTPMYDAPDYDAPARGHLRGLAAVTIAVIASLALMIGAATPALAHNVLISTSPSDGDVLDAAPEQILLTFDQPVSNFEPVLMVFGPNGNDFAAPNPTITGSEVTSAFSAGEAGEYRVAYRVVSADGHPVAGEYHFTLTGAAAGDATGTPADQQASQDDDGDAAAIGTWVWVLVAMAGVLLVVALVITLVKPRRRSE